MAEMSPDKRAELEANRAANNISKKLQLELAKF